MIELTGRIVLGPHRYGKAENRVVRIVRDTDRHEIRDPSVSSCLHGDFDAAHLEGDQGTVLPTDSQKQTIYSYAKEKGGGFGAKQEMLVEDVVAAAVLRTGRPVQWEFTRSDQLTVAPCRHPMRVDVTLAADADGVLTALVIDVLADAGAYGNHSPGVMFHGCTESIAVYRCPNKRVDAESVYTNNRPSGAFRGYGLGQVIFAVESAMDELAGKLGIDPYEFRRRNIIVPGDPLVAAHPEGADLTYGSYGLDQCLDLAERAMARTAAGPRRPVITGGSARVWRWP